jgi:uncharacterized protein (TIGR03435 family)
MHGRLIIGLFFAFTVCAQNPAFVAKTATPVPPERMRLMLRTLLAERMNLTAHRGTKLIPVYALVPAKSGPKLLIAAAEEKSAMNRIEGSLVFARLPGQSSQAISRRWCSADGP